MFTLLFIIYHLIRATLLAWLSIPFFITGWIFMQVSEFLFFVARSLKDNIPFSPFAIWKNLLASCFEPHEYNKYTGKRKKK